MMNEREYFGHGAYDYFMHKKEMALREQGLTEKEIEEVLRYNAPTEKKHKIMGVFKRWALSGSFALRTFDESEYDMQVVRPTRDERVWAAFDKDEFWMG